MSPKAVPSGDVWVHEVKFDGYRVQAHKVGLRVMLFGREGTPSRSASPPSRSIWASCPKAVVLDGEVG